MFFIFHCVLDEEVGKIKAQFFYNSQLEEDSCDQRNLIA